MDGVLERLYTPEGATLAASWLWENRANLTSNLATAAPVAMYAAVHAVAKFGNPTDGWMTSAEDAEFIGIMTEFAEVNGHHFSEATQGPGSGLLAAALMAIAKKLLEKLLEETS